MGALDGATLITPTPAPARTKGSAPGSPTPPGPTRPAPLLQHPPMFHMVLQLLHPLPSLLQSTLILLIIITLLAGDTKVDSKAFPTLELFSHTVNSSPSLLMLFLLHHLRMLSSSK